MKNFIRLQAFTDNGYPRISVQIWRKQDIGQYWFRPIGEVLFTNYRGERYDHYKVTCECEPHEYQNLIEMGKLIKYARENSSWDCDIQEFIKIIEGEEIVQYGGEMIPIKEDGNYFFACYDQKYNVATTRWEKCEGIYTCIFAPNEMIAHKLAKKFYPKMDFVIEQGRQIDVKPFNFDKG